MMTKQALCSARVVGATLAILGVACGSRDGHGSDDPQPSAGEIAKAVDAWQQSPLKTCSLDAIFPWVSAPQPSPREGWDLGQVMKKLDPNRVWTVGDKHVLFGVFPGLEEGQGRISWKGNTCFPATAAMPIVSKDGANCSFLCSSSSKRVDCALR